MKQISIIIAISLVGVIYIQAQCTLAYKAISSFKNDTTAFMKYNFADRALCYKGKTVNDVLNDLNNSKVPTKSYVYGIKMDKSTNGVEMIVTVTIFLYNNNTATNKIKSRINGQSQKLNALKMFFETPIEFKPNKNVFANNLNSDWTTTIKNFFSPKKIKEVKFIE